MITQADKPVDLSAMHLRRKVLSQQFLKGEGIEIGALHQPLWIPPSATVQYVDRMQIDDLRRQYPELASVNLTPVDRIDDGEKLATFSANSLDFIVANHMLEHCENPIGTIRSHLSKLKPGGVLYYAIPDKRFTFDLKRPLTSWDHFLRDENEGSTWSRHGHFDEYVSLVENIPEGQPRTDRVNHLLSINYSIHFHVWDAASFNDFLRLTDTHLRSTNSTGFEICILEENQLEVVAILRKPQTFLSRVWRKLRP